MTTELGFAYGYDHTMSERAPIRAELIGSEIVVSFDGDQLYRSEFNEVDIAHLESLFSKRFLKLAMQFDSRLKGSGL